MYEYETYRARTAELHAIAANDRLALEALRARRAAHRTQRRLPNAIARLIGAHNIGAGEC